MFPVVGPRHDGTSQVVAFSGRRHPRYDKRTDDLLGPYLQPKYVNTGSTPLYTKGEHLYGLENVRAAVAAGGAAVLVEGPLDALAVDLSGTDQHRVGVASLGTAVTDRHAAAVAPRREAVVVAMDGDGPGRAAEQHAYKMLTAAGLDPHSATLPDGRDPADVRAARGGPSLGELVSGTEPLSARLAWLAAGEVHSDELYTQRLAARAAAEVIVHAPLDTWPAVTGRVAQTSNVPAALIAEYLAQTVPAEPLGRLAGRDQRDDLDRGQHLDERTAAQFAAASTPPMIRPGPSRAIHTPLIDGIGMDRLYGRRDERVRHGLRSPGISMG